MAIGPEADEYLAKAGFKYHCFLSWARLQHADYIDQVRLLKAKLQDELTFVIDKPRVFLDLDDIPAGADWEHELTEALCKSLTLVAICSPMYFDPRHTWCGREYAAMDALAKSRFPTNHLSPIIPLLVRDNLDLPTCVQRHQVVDITPIHIKGKRYLNTAPFRTELRRVVDRIETVVQTIASGLVARGCDESFVVTATYPFSDRPALKPELPITGRGHQ